MHEIIGYVIGAIMIIVLILFGAFVLMSVFNLWIIRKVELDLIDYIQNRNIRRTLDDKLKLLLFRIGGSLDNKVLMDFRNRRILRIDYSYSFIGLMLRGWQNCWDGKIYFEVETGGPIHLEIKTVVEVLPDFKEEALKLLIARKFLLGRTHEKMDPQ